MTLWDKAEVVLVQGPNYSVIMVDIYASNEKNTTSTQFSKEYNKLIYNTKYSSISATNKYSPIFYRNGLYYIYTNPKKSLANDIVILLH